MKRGSMTRVYFGLFVAAISASTLFYPRQSWAQTYKESILYNFPANASGSDQVPANLVMDSAGNLYGVTEVGGDVNPDCSNAGCGEIFKISTQGVESVVYAFSGLSDGFLPCCLVIDKSGNLYGTTYAGGIGDGIVFKFVTKTKKFFTLHEFGSSPNDGHYPTGPLFINSAGDLYGTTLYGGVNSCGTIFEVTSKGVETAVHNFSSALCIPLGNVERNNQGDFYGVGANGSTLYEVTSAGDELVLNDGLEQNQGTNITTGLVSRDAAGNFYGTFDYYAGGGYYAGVWEVGGDNHLLTEYFLALDCIPGNCSSFLSPYGSLGLGDGVIYGTAAGGGPINNGGGVYELKETTGAITVLYYFTAEGFASGAPETDGASPEWGVIVDSKGNLYGTTLVGGTADGYGTVFKLARN